jgi:hypothetical protein
MDALQVTSKKSGITCHLIENLLASERILKYLAQALEARSDTRLVVQGAAISLAVYQACRPQVGHYLFHQRYIAQVQPFGNLLIGPSQLRVLVKESQDAELLKRIDVPGTNELGYFVHLPCSPFIEG